MTFGWVFAVVTLASFAVVVTLSSASVPAMWRRLQGTGGAADRASRLLALRVLPAAVSVLAGALAAVSFLRFEPPGKSEAVGFVVLLLAAWGLALILSAPIRLVAVHLRTRRVVRGWMTTARPLALPGSPLPAWVVEADFPIVAVVGILKPRLILARSVVERCSADELEAILAHEHAHLRRHDNARRALLQSLPDPLGWLPISRAIDRAWHDVTEEAADDAAAASGESIRVHLASALVRVARLAPAAPRVLDLPASALFRGEPLERRIRRLLDRSGSSTIPERRTAWWLAVSAVLAIGVLGNLNLVHHLTELAITYLP
jgi:Zn-dependent protease with chaperone function